jgi:hypothetical protein
MFHEHGNNDIDKDKLGHQNKDDEENWSNDWTDAAIHNAVVGIIAVITQCVLLYD